MFDKLNRFCITCSCTCCLRHNLLFHISRSIWHHFKNSVDTSTLHHFIIILHFPGFPNGLSIDYASERLYWADAKLDKIETSTLEGNFRVTLVRNVPHPFGLSVVGNLDLPLTVISSYLTVGRRSWILSQNSRY